MNKGIVLIFGLIGGILAILGVFLSWASVQMSMPGLGVSANGDIRGWDMARGEATLTATANGQTASQTVPGPSETSPYVVLAGGIIALVGAFAVLAAKVKWVSIVLLIGGVVAIIGVGWGFSVIQTGSSVPLFGLGNFSSSYGYGLYLCLVGGILGLIGGIMGVTSKA